MLTLEVKEVIMVVIFGLGLVVGVLVVLGLLRLTAQAEPTGCIILLCTLAVLVCWALLLLPKIGLGS
jgi:hypothetical protein